MKRMKVVFLLLVSSHIFGCTHLSEGMKGFLGISTKILEEKRKFSEKKIFRGSLQECFKLTEDFLKETKSYIYSRKPKMLAIYVSETDTTPVGIFFEQEDVSHTQVEVSSPSSFAKEEFAQRLFAYLEQKLTLKEKDE